MFTKKYTLIKQHKQETELMLLMHTRKNVSQIYFLIVAGGVKNQNNIFTTLHDNALYQTLHDAALQMLKYGNMLCVLRITF